LTGVPGEPSTVRDRYRILLHDVVVGLGPVVVAGPSLVGRIGPWLVLPVALGGLAAGGAQYLVERDALPDRVADVRDNPAALAGALLVAFAVAVAPVLVRPSVSRWYLAAGAGAGLGILAHRVVFGVIRPLPDLVADERPTE